MQVNWLVLIGCLLVACASASCSGGSDCLTADSIKELKTVRVGDTDFHLYRRTSGLNDKASFYQLYVGKPVFDRCGKAASQPVADAYIDLTEGHPTKIIVENGLLELTYSKDGTEPLDLDAVEVVVK